MSTITIRILAEKYERLKLYAKMKRISVNKLFDELSTIALTQFDTRIRFEALASKGNKKRGLELLEKIDNELKK